MEEDVFRKVLLDGKGDDVACRRGFFVVVVVVVVVKLHFEESAHFRI
jgi:hypothetical protein